MKRRTKGSRFTPPKVRGLSGARRDAAHLEIGKRIGAHLDLHRSWEGTLHGKRVRLWLDDEGKLHHRILGKA